MNRQSEKNADTDDAQLSAYRLDQGERHSVNERLILSILRNDGPNAKAEIARQTGLSAQSASVIMRRLEKQGLIERCAPVRGKVGQPSVPMRLAPSGALFFGLKVGRRSAELLLVDFLGSILDWIDITYRYPDPEQTLDFVQKGVETLSARLSPSLRKRVSGMGISIPGYLWEWARIVGERPETLAAWRDRDMREDIAALFNFPVFRQNDASCACGAELVFGGQDFPRDYMYFYVGYFIGGGVVLNGTLFTGPTGNAGAIAPLPVPTSVSETGQLIDVASLSGLERALADAGHQTSSLWQRPLSWDIDPDILNDWMDRASKGLAHAIVASCAVIDFELIVLDGWLPAEVRSELVARTEKVLPSLNLAGLIRPEIREGKMGLDARPLGAASLPLSRNFMVSQRAI